jgi:hypothetical protein
MLKRAIKCLLLLLGIPFALTCWGFALAERPIRPGALVCTLAICIVFLIGIFQLTASRLTAARSARKVCRDER